MGSILQSYEIKQPVRQVLPLEHYRGKPDAHGWQVSATPLLTLNYLDVTTELVGSQPELALSRMAAVERSFQSAASHIPVQLSITKTPRAPLSWNVTYLYPVGTLKDFVSRSFEQSSLALAYDPVGVMTWSLQAQMDYQYYGTAVSRMRIEGFQLSDLQIQISATTDFAVAAYESAVGVLLEGLDLDINPHTLVATEAQTEDTSLETFWQYNWTFGVD